MTRIGRARVVVVALVLTFAAVPLMASSIEAQDASAAPTSAEAACQSVDDLQIIIEFTQDSIEADAGFVPVAVGVIAGLSEARDLTGYVGETYRPLVEDLFLSLQDLRDALGELENLETAGAKLASIGQSVTEIGIAMDALGVQLNTSCSTEG